MKMGMVGFIVSGKKSEKRVNMGEGMFPHVS